MRKHVTSSNQVLLHTTINESQTYIVVGIHFYTIIALMVTHFLILLLLTMLNTMLFPMPVFAPLGTMMWHHRGTGGAATPIRDTQLCGVREPSMPYMI